MPAANAPTAAIFGVGPGLGLATARYLGGRGYELVLVARNQERLGAFAQDLAGEGMEVSTYAGDIADPAGLDAVVGAITARHDRIDLAVYQSAGPDPSVASVLEIDAENERPFIDRLLLGPIHALHTLMAPMLERGDGTVVVTVGSSALGPSPAMSQYGIPQAGLRNHVLGLADAAAPAGVRVGLLVVGGLILGSDLQHNWVPDAGPDFPGALDPAELARELGSLVDGTAGPERIVDPFGAAASS